MIKIDQVSNACISVTMDEISSGWEQWVMLSSDRHYDSVKCDRSLMKKQLEKAKSRNALIIDVGDLFDVMQGRFDPRRSYAEMRPEYKDDNFLDAIVSDAANFFAPYANNLLMIGRGNHDQSVIRNNGVDIISNLVYHLNRENNGQIKVGGYGGWVKFLFKTGKSESRNLKYFHGGGGDSPVTRGIIDTARQAVYLPDADFVVNGHNHNTYHAPISRERLTNRGVVKQDLVHFIRTPSYAFDYGDGTTGWHVERRGQPKPRGCVWLRFFYHNNEIFEEVILDSV
jgi:hypothetical protein